MVWLTRLLAVIGLLVIMLLGTIFYFLKSDKQTMATPENQVLTFTIKGNLAEKSTQHQLLSLLKDQELSLRGFIDTLDAASHDPSIKGILVRLDQAHLSIAKIQEIHAAIKRFKAKGKFAFAHADTYGEGENGTGVYYLASVFDEIALQPMGTLNLIGLTSELPFLKKLFDEIGVDPKFERREEYKSFVEMYTNYTISPENRDSRQRLLNGLMSQIIHDIGQERDIRTDELDQLINKGPYFRPDEAQKLGFIDHIYYLDEFEAQALKKAGNASELVAIEDYAAKIPNKDVKGQPSVALIYGTGSIVRTNFDDVPLINDDMFTSEDVKQAFEEACEDDNVKAIVFRINSPGGSPVASETIARQIDCAHKKGIPVVVYMSDYAASGGYWIASRARKIVAQPGTITGSIGVFGGKFVVSGLWDKLGVSWSVLKSGENANMDSMHYDFTPAQMQKNKEWLDYIYDQFIRHVATGRHLDYDTVHKMAKGQVWTGEEALKLKLIDQLGDMQTAIEIAKQEAKIDAHQSINIQDFPRKKSKFDHVLSIISGNSDISKAIPAFKISNPRLKILWRALLTPTSSHILEIPEHVPVQ